MGLQGAFRPKSLESRYAQLTDQQKTVYYAFRRHLGMSSAQVEALPWWERRYLIEKLNEEFAHPEDDDDDFTTITADDEVSNNAESMGFTVHTV